MSGEGILTEGYIGDTMEGLFLKVIIIGCMGSDLFHCGLLYYNL